MNHNLHPFRWIMGLTLAATIGMPEAFAATKADPPNILIIMTDDMGFSDLGCYGSEIETPNLDGLAKQGLRFTQFYNTGRCCPTRASLLTGLYQHQAGVGAMTKDEGPSKPGYRGRLMDQCVTIAEVLKPAGYQTIQTGKWHVGSAKTAWWPLARGFDRCYTCPEGGGFYFRPKPGRTIIRGNDLLYDQKKAPPSDWYTTDAWTEEGLEYVQEAIKRKKPFLWYLAHNAPHFPLKAKPEDIAKYRGKYKGGWDDIREQRYKRLIELGMIDSNWKLSPRDNKVPAWDSLSEKEKDQQDLRMATYAAMVDCVDQNVGKIISKLKEWKIYENTLILFLHDNGGSDEGGARGSNKGKGECGTVDSYAFYGACWANASNTPFRKYKKRIHEGGISSPLIAHWPRGIHPDLKGTLVHKPTHLIDLMATCVDLSTAEYPETYKGKNILPMEGKSLRPIFQKKPFQREAPLFFEHYGNRGIRKGQWKLVSASKGPWELYDMENDRTELDNLAAEQSTKVQELSALYQAWADRCNVPRKARKN